MSPTKRIPDFKTVGFPGLTEIDRSELGLIPDCARILSEMIEQFDNRRPDPYLPRWCWECWECYSIGGGSLFLSGRPHETDPEMQLIIRLGLVDIFSSGFEEQDVLRFLRSQRQMSEAFIQAYCSMIKKVEVNQRKH